MALWDHFRITIQDFEVPINTKINNFPKQIKTLATDFLVTVAMLDIDFFVIRNFNTTLHRFLCKDFFDEATSLRIENTTFFHLFTEQWGRDHCLAKTQ